MTGLQFGKALAARPTPIPGVVLFDLPVHGDNRGWFKENWQREKMAAAGLPDFGPVQNNISFNESAGTTRGIHAEPWEKFISVATGRVFGAWVDLREGPSFGTVFTAVLDPSTAIFIPRGVGNAFQTLEDGTAYSYLVNAHWSPAARYTFLNLADETANIPWPIPLAAAELSDKDKTHPRLADVVPMQGKRTLVLGANGQLGRALAAMFDADPTVEFAGRTELDLAGPDPFGDRDFAAYDTIINAAAYTSVDAAETPAGRAAAWAVNASALAALARKCTEHRITLVHISSDYVFDGTVPVHDEDEPLSPLGVYGQSKAAGDVIIATVPHHYILRTSWVIGEGNNFVRTMAALSERGIKPRVVNDQFGRLTFTADLAAAVGHLLGSGAPFGTYNVSNSGPDQSWAEIAADIFELSGRSRDDVTGVSSECYFAEKQAAPRPRHSTLNLQKLARTGLDMPSAAVRLREYLEQIRH
ncbi:dTDP-4-dehydrorhamnose reductase [Arthrobacter sp. ERGS1:01]|uniref:sugar nucleotide-binding protein n=1 Tax=Arthrobacter sp. ERGS1:01 TaxID=1704044 RepID=UPI0006B480CC|nr:bifunctional dTDP-4-dehydrorhamnose 3,5-epimerase family protein/NAD(P)-dependent oxidoreductase [Arthrobacter sp. ERGS1:01]ALE05158.1 dTDP-4-dehydrorhamnose reductase [Arthrobacter sp. ERGS1:01]